MKQQINSDVLAVVIHAYYVDVFAKILQSLAELNTQIMIYVTTTRERESEIKQILLSSGFNFYLLVLPNRGRDVLPFLRVMPKVIQADHAAVLKLHTKKTEHRNDGNVWMDDILGKLVDKSKVGRYLALINNDNNIGMIAPAGHIVGMMKYCGSNKKNILRIAEKLGVSKAGVMKQTFVAGTMFYAHVSALKPLIALAFTDDAFEAEDNQIDGTLAHAIERCFAISCVSSNLKLISSESVNSPYSYTVQENYAFAEDGYASVVCKFNKLIAKIKNMMFRL